MAYHHQHLTVLQAPHDADAVRSLSDHPSESIGFKRTWTERALCVDPGMLDLWARWSAFQPDWSEPETALFQSLVAMQTCRSPEHLHSFLQASLSAVRQMRQPLSHMLARLAPGRLHRRRGLAIDLNGVLLSMFSEPSIRDRALQLLQCDGQSKYDAIYSAALLVSRMPNNRRQSVAVQLGRAILAEFPNQKFHAPRVIVGEAGTPSFVTARLTADRLGLPLRVVDHPDTLKRSLDLSVFLESGASECVVYTESPPTPLAQVLVAGLASHVTVLLATGGDFGAGPGLSQVDDLANPTDPSLDTRDVSRRILALITDEWYRLTRRREWNRVTASLAGDFCLALDPATDSAGRLAEAISRHFSRDAATPVPPSEAARAGGPDGRSRSSTAEERNPLDELIDLCRTIAGQSGDPETPGFAERSPVDNLDAGERARFRTALRAGDWDLAGAMAGQWQLPPVSRLFTALRHGPVASPVHVELLRSLFPNRPPAPKIFFFGPPKSPAIHFARAAALAAEWPMRNLAREGAVGWDGYATPQLEAFFRRFDEPVVVWSHGPASPLTVTLLRAFDFPVLCCVGTVWDDLIREFKTWAPPADGTGDRLLDGRDTTEEHRPWPLFLRGFAPYLRFYVGWVRAVRSGIATGEIMRFDHALGRQEEILDGLLQKVGANPSPESVGAAIARASAPSPHTRHLPHPEFGPPIPDGIGYREFAGEFQELASHCYRLFPDTDFEPIDPGNPFRDPDPMLSSSRTACPGS